MKYSIGTLIVAKSKTVKTTAYAIITDYSLETKRYKICLQRIHEDGKIERDFGQWTENELNLWEDEYGYIFSE